MNNTMTTEEMLWQAIKDIENGNSKLMKDDPIDGFITGKKVSLTKKNVCDQTAKYNNYKSISRPTLDSYKDIALYITQKKESKSKNVESLERQLKEIQSKYDKLNETLKEQRELNSKMAQENYRLLEESKQSNVKLY